MNGPRSLFSPGSSQSDITASQYKVAASQFLNRQFTECFETVEPLLKTNSTRAWCLYLALAESALNSANSNISKQLKRHFKSQVFDGKTIWDAAGSAFAPETIPPQVVVPIAILCTKYSDSEGRESLLEPTQKVLEQSLASSADDDIQSRALLDVYVYKVLCQRGQFDYAREVASASGLSVDKVSEMEHELNREREQKRVEEEQLRQKERERVEEAINRQTSQPQSPRREKSQSQTPSVQPQSPRVERQLPLSSTDASQKSEITNQPRAVHDISSLVRHWKSRFVALTQSKRFLQIVLFVSVVVLTGANPIARRRILGLLKLLLAKLMHTLRMGTKVSYV
ncbi:hypothetical protein TRVA0_031S00232 [Trichomonascus vanleenenianus]|uniref:uncharacterized protein n=1 Tax=Trichomonascus vanleenenianus TaxID=2268995 RepID=UPI003ECA6A98